MEAAMKKVSMTRYLTKSLQGGQPRARLKLTSVKAVVTVITQRTKEMYGILWVGHWPSYLCLDRILRLLLIFIYSSLK